MPAPRCPRFRSGARRRFPARAAHGLPTFRSYNGKYHLYYALSTFGSRNSAIGLATNVTLDAADPDYKWVDEGMVLRSFQDKDDWNAIDANLVVENENSVWLNWGSFWGGIKMRRLDPATGKPSDKDTTLYSLCSRPREQPIGGSVEAPFIVKHADYWYLFVSYDRCCRGVEQHVQRGGGPCEADHRTVRGQGGQAADRRRRHAGDRGDDAQLARSRSRGDSAVTRAGLPGVSRVPWNHRPVVPAHLDDGVGGWLAARGHAPVEQFSERTPAMSKVTEKRFRHGRGRGALYPARTAAGRIARPHQDRHRARDRRYRSEDLRQLHRAPGPLHRWRHLRGEARRSPTRTASARTCWTRRSKLNVTHAALAGRQLLLELSLEGRHRPRDQRPPRLEMAWGTVESNRFGTHEFLQYAEMIGTEPYICCNLGTGIVGRGAAVGGVLQFRGRHRHDAPAQAERPRSSRGR